MKPLSSTAIPSIVPPKPAVRQLDQLLEEFKAQESSFFIPEPSPYRQHQSNLHSSGKDSADYGLSTNLFINNLPPSATEEVLKSMFCRFGKVDSVKIMWPRTEEELARKRNNGFVNFATREDAADALVCLVSLFLLHFGIYMFILLLTACTILSNQLLIYLYYNFTFVRRS